MRLFLFDLDGTLVTTKGAGVRALEQTFLDLFSVSDAAAAINPSGKTDPKIFREIMRAAFNREIPPDEMERICRHYLAVLRTLFDRPLASTPLPGVLEFLSHLKNRNGDLMGLGTGNLEEGARIKLSGTALNDFFEFGGFGSDSEDRPELLAIAHRRAELKAGARIDPDDVFIIGDTPLDVAAARAAGYRCVAVASGKYESGALEGAKPDYLFSSMNDGFAWLETL